MINLLPPSAKSDKAFARRNAILVRYVWVLVFLIVAAGVELGGTELYLARQRKVYDKQIATKQQQIAGFSDLQAQAKSANARLKAFKGLVGNQAKFSELLADLASHTPKGVFINSIALTGNSSTAVQVAATGNSYESVASFRDALVTSPRISEADIQNVSNPAAGIYNVNITIAFKPGEAR